MKDRKSEFNRLCAKCLRHCKQSNAAELVDCPRYLPRPFKVAEHRFDQLGLFEETRSKERRKKAGRS